MKNGNGVKSMNRDLKMVKFNKMIKGIFEKLNFFSNGVDSWLNVIYDYSKLNDFGKAIMEVQSFARVSSPARFEHMDVGEWIKDWVESGILDDLDYRDENALYKEKMHFIFWALMILAVDDADKEEHLSLICDFARILNISDIEMMDVVKVVCLVFHKDIDGELVSDGANRFFKNLFDYGQVELTDYTLV